MTDDSLPSNPQCGCPVSRHPGHQVYHRADCWVTSLVGAHEEIERLRAALRGAVAYITMDSEHPPMLEGWRALALGPADETSAPPYYCQNCPCERCGNTFNAASLCPTCGRLGAPEKTSDG